MKHANIDRLTDVEIKVILRAADEIIGQGGRSLLAKILKGSRDKRVLQLELDSCPVYGWFKSEKLDDITAKVDWMIDCDFLEVSYSGKLPMIIFTERGWEIERDQMVDELLQEWKDWIKQGKRNPDMTYLKDRNRQMILLLLEKAKESGNQAFIPYLTLWEKIEYKKVRQAIRATIEALENNEQIDVQLVEERTASIREALKGSPPQDMRLKCWECGERFTFSVREQQFFKQKRFNLPKRCGTCRFQREEMYF